LLYVDCTVTTESAGATVTARFSGNSLFDEQERHKARIAANARIREQRVFGEQFIGCDLCGEGSAF